MTASTTDAEPVRSATRTRSTAADLERRAVARLLRHLRSGPTSGLRDTIKAQLRAGERAEMIVRAFYAVSLLWVTFTMGRWNGYRDLETIEPLWPAGWIPSDDPRTGVTIVVYSTMVTGFAALAFPRSRITRLAYAVSLLQFLSVSMAFGKINHDYHAWLWTSGLLVLLPTARQYRSAASAVRHRVLGVLWAAQLLILFFYTLTGLWKLYYAVRALASPAVSAFEIDGFSLIIADRLLQTNQQTLLGDTFVHNTWPGWLLFNGTMYLEAASILIAFRPRLHRLWGIGLLSFHFGTQLTMGFTFIPNVVLLGLLFVASPWAPDRVDVRAAVGDLPGILFLRRTVERLRRRSTAATATS